MQNTKKELLLWRGMFAETALIAMRSYKKFGDDSFKEHADYFIRKIKKIDEKLRQTNNFLL